MATLLKALVNKWTIGASAALLLVGMIWSAGAIHGQEKEREASKVEIARVQDTLNARTDELRDARTAIDQAVAAANTANTAHVEALKLQKAGFEKLLADQAASLDQAQAKLKQYQTVLNTTPRIKTYVTPVADRAPISDGFVWVLNQALDDSAAAATAAGFPAGGPPDVDAPSGIPASEVAASVAGNYAICRYNASLVLEWQAWYTRSKSVYDQAVQATKVRP